MEIDKIGSESVRAHLLVMQRITERRVAFTVCLFLAMFQKVSYSRMDKMLPRVPPGTIYLTSEIQIYLTTEILERAIFVKQNQQQGRDGINFFTDDHHYL